MILIVSKRNYYYLCLGENKKPRFRAFDAAFFTISIDAEIFANLFRYNKIALRCLYKNIKIISS